MLYDEAPFDCPRCRHRTWHGKNVVGIFRARSLTALSHAITVFNNRVVPWRCLDCGNKRWGRADPGPYLPRRGGEGPDR